VKWLVGFTATFLAFSNSQASSNETIAQPQLEVLARVYASCAAYAFIQTSYFPELQQLRNYKNHSLSAAEAERAEEGLSWTVRVMLSSEELARTKYKLSGLIPSRGEVNSEVAAWVKQLNVLSQIQLEGIGTNCKSWFEAIDHNCSRVRCVDYDGGDFRLVPPNKRGPDNGRQ